MNLIEQKARVYYNDELAGYLSKTRNGYVFSYEDNYIHNKSKPGIAITFPKSQKEFHSQYLFPFFFGLLSEGANKELQCRTLKIDEKDYFTRLIKTAGSDTIGAVTVKEEK
jgi:serine/threonine-protein kinase HipA